MLPIRDTFILVSADCPALAGTVPPRRGGKESVAEIEHRLLTAEPYRLTQDELIFQTHVHRLGLTPAEAEAQRDALWSALFARSHPCLRASPLLKRYGWGAHYDDAGRIALYGRESPEYARWSATPPPGTEVVSAMRNRRG